MKYYVYVSETKVTMLYSQIAKSSRQTREASIGFDVKVVKGELKQEREVSDTVYSRLEEVLNELNRSKMVTTTPGVAPYISGRLDMVWANFGWDPESPITLWTYYDDNYALGLVGSRHHVIGERRPDGYAHSHSGTDAIEVWFSNQLSEPGQRSKIEHAEGRLNFHVSNEGALGLAWLAISQAHGSKQSFEFVAKVLQRGVPPSVGRNIILASPLYVAN